MPKKKNTVIRKGPNPRASIPKKAGAGTRGKRTGTTNASQRNSGAGWYTKGGRRQAG